MRYLLDTNICICLIKRKSPVILERLKNALPSGVGISSVTLAELEYGVRKSIQVERNELALLQFCALPEIFPFDDAAARQYGIVRADLEKKGKLIGGMDMLITAHALSLDLTLVTNNTREFQRVAGIRLENWTE